MARYFAGFDPNSLIPLFNHPPTRGSYAERFAWSSLQERVGGDEAPEKRKKPLGWPAADMTLYVKGFDKTPILPSDR
jgi:hypothetical protein